MISPPDKPCDGDICGSKDLCSNIICGQNAECHIVNETAKCECIDGCIGDPMKKCSFNETSTEKAEIVLCSSISCVANAVCLEQNGNATCECLPGYDGNPDKECSLKIQKRK